MTSKIKNEDFKLSNLRILQLTIISKLAIYSQVCENADITVLATSMQKVDTTNCFNFFTEMSVANL